jgi:hypothetical protein
MPTIIDLGRQTKTKYPQYQDLSDDELGRRIKAKYPSQYSDYTDVFPTQEPEQVKMSFMQKLGNFGLGAVKGVASTVVNSTDLVQQGLEKITTPLANKITGKKIDNKTVKQIVPERAITPTNTAQKIGFGMEQVAEFLIPGAAGLKASKGARMVTKVATGAAEAGLVTTAQGGDEKQVRNAVLTGGVLPIVGKAAKGINSQVFEKLPKRIIQNVVGQSKAEKLAGKDISEYVLKTKKVGTANKLIKDSSEAVKRLGNEIQNNLENVASKTTRILKNDILGQVTKKINAEGGEISSKEVASVIENLAPQVKSLLKRQSLSLPEANRLRQSLDKTLGDKGFLMSQLPFNKTVLKSFDDILREKVKTLAPKGTRESFEELSKEITLRNSLMDKYAGKSGNQVLNAFDYILAGGGFAGGGLPGAIASVAVKKITQSPYTKTAAAQFLDKSGKLIKKGKKINPLVKGALIKASSSSSNNQ